MIWQDLVFAVGMILLTIFLIPAVRSNTHKPPLTTSLGHGAVMIVFTLTYVTLHFWFATAMAAAEGALWFWLATQHGHVSRALPSRPHARKGIGGNDPLRPSISEREA